MATLKLGTTTAITESSGALTIASSTLTTPTIASMANCTFPAGHIIQTKALSHNYTQAISGTTSEIDMQQSSGVVWEPSITVTSGNKVLINITANLKGNAATADARSHFRLYQKIGSGSYSLLVYNGESIGGYDYGGNGIWTKIPHSMIFLSSPNSGDLIKYKISVQPQNTATSIGVNDSANDITHILLQEVQV